MKYFLISNMYPDNNHPGYGSFVKNICEALEKEGIHKQYMAVIYGGGKGKINKLQKYIKAISSIYKNYFKQYDFIYIHYPNQFVPFLLPLFHISKKPIIVNFHGEDLVFRNFGYRKILGNLTRKFVRKFASGIIVPSDYFKEVAKDIFKNKIPITVSPSGGINPNFFYPTNSQQKSVQELTIGFIGRLQEDKGILEFLSAFKRLKEENMIEVKALIVGYGPLYEQVIKFIKENSYQDYIQFFPGIPQKELGNKYRRMDLFIFNSWRESLGLTGLEAMGCGVPVIGSDIGGIKTYLKDGYNGWLIPPHDIDSIVEAVWKWKKLPLSQKEQIQINCVATAEQYYTPKIASQMKFVFNQFLRK